MNGDQGSAPACRHTSVERGWRWFLGPDAPKSRVVWAWAALSLSFLALLVTRVLGPAGTVALDDYGCALAPGVAAVACFRARRRAAGRPGGHRCAGAWLLLALAMSSWTAAGVAWTVYEVHMGREVAFPSPLDVGYLLMVPLAIAGLVRFPGARLTGVARLRPLLDGVIAAGALLFVSWTMVIGPMVAAGEGSLAVQLTALAYPALDVVTASVALLTMSRAQGERRRTMLVVGVGLLIVAFSDSTFAFFTARGAYESGNLFDAGYVAGFLLIAIAAGWAHRSQAAGTAGETEHGAGVESAPTRLSLSLPYLPLAMSLPFAFVQQSDGKLRSVELAIFMTVIVAVLARQLLSLQVIVRLRDELHDTVAALRAREVDLQFQAFHDPLTGLANRALFADRITHSLAQADRGSSKVVLLLADLDDFKTVNDTLGHPAGDALLVAVAERLRAVVRPGDTVARLGGDEFAVLLERCDGLSDAREVAERIEHALLQAFVLSGMQTVMAASIGIAVADGLTDGAALLRDADIAMYAAKAEGKAGYAVYAPALAEANVGRLQLKGDLGHALSRHELSLSYQPVVDLQTGLLCGVEALLRWDHPVQGSVSPEVFIPLAEHSGSIIDIGQWVLTQACAEAGRWERHRPAGSLPVQLAVNVSGRQLTEPGLVPAVRDALHAAGLRPRLLTVEITETLLLDEAVVLAPLRALRELGVRIAIDDFGTGHSTLSRLARFPIDTLKIDQSFVSALTRDSEGPDVLISAILAMGQGLGINVIAEGVETDDQLRALRAHGCGQAQGFLFARAVAPGVIDDLVRTQVTLTDPTLLEGVVQQAIGS